MSEYIFKMPDLGEGTVEAEIVAWHTAPGDAVAEDQIIVEVMTDKAAVEVPAPVSGRVVSIRGAPGDKIAVGSPLIVFETAPAPTRAAQTPPAPSPAAPATPAAPADVSARAAPAVGRIMTSPANRRRAREAGIDLATVAGSGPGGRIVREDLKAASAARPDSDATARTQVVPGAAARSPQPPSAGGETSEIKVIGVRRLIAERTASAKRDIPHFAYVEEVDVTELEALRQHLNSKLAKGEPSLTYLPLVILALVPVYAALTGETTAQVLATFAGKGFGEFKSMLADLLVARLAPVSEAMRRMLADPAEIDRILSAGAQKARTLAAPTLAETQRIVGFWRGG